MIIHICQNKTEQEHSPLESGSDGRGGLNPISPYSSTSFWPYCPTIFDAISARFDVLVHKLLSVRNHNVGDNRSVVVCTVLSGAEAC